MSPIYKRAWRDLGLAIIGVFAAYAVLFGLIGLIAWIATNEEAFAGSSIFVAFCVAIPIMGGCLVVRGLAHAICPAALPGLTSLFWAFWLVLLLGFVYLQAPVLPVVLAGFALIGRYLRWSVRRQRVTAALAGWRAEH